MHCFDDNLQALKKQRKELKKRLAGGELPKRHQAFRSGSSASSLKVDGRKLSSSEVERIVAEAQNTNAENVEPKDDSKAEGSSSPKQTADGDQKPSTVDDTAKANGDASHSAAGSSQEKVGGDAKQERTDDSAKNTFQPHDSGIHV